MAPRRKKTKELKEWRDKLIERDDGCIICGETNHMNAHHLIPFSKKYEKWNHDVDNGVMLCPTHHMWGIDSAHKNPFWFFLWMKIHRDEQLELALNRLVDFDEI